MTKNKRPFFLFYLLVFYVLLQFSWWAYLLLSLNSEVYVHKKESIFLSSSTITELLNKETELNHKLNNRLLMIAGEGAVFIIILLIGISRVKKSFQKEMEINLQQKNFLLSVTHELKSPIASARLQLETFLKRDLDKITQQKIITNALNDTNRLNDLVEKVLLATRIESTANFDVIEKINVSNYLSDLVNQTKKTGVVKQTISTNIEPNLHLLISPDDWGFIINNLLENAIKYSPSETTICVNLSFTNEIILLGVTDEGETIPENEKDKITEKFYRIGNEDTRKTKGTGLGLYIVKSLVEKYNGILTIRNNEPTGNCFEIQFNVN